MKKRIFDLCAVAFCGIFLSCDVNGMFLGEGVELKPNGSATPVDMSNTSLTQITFNATIADIHNKAGQELFNGGDPSRIMADSVTQLEKVNNEAKNSTDIPSQAIQNVENQTSELKNMAICMEIQDKIHEKEYWLVIQNPNFLKVFCKGDAKRAWDTIFAFTTKAHGYIKSLKDIFDKIETPELSIAVIENLHAGADRDHRLAVLKTKDGAYSVWNDRSLGECLDESYTNDVTGDIHEAIANGALFLQTYQTAVSIQHETCIKGFKFAFQRNSYLISSYGDKAGKYTAPLLFDPIEIFMGLPCTQFTAAGGNPTSLRKEFTDKIAPNAHDAAYVNLFSDNTAIYTHTREKILPASLELIKNLYAQGLGATGNRLGNDNNKRGGGFWHLGLALLQIYSTGHVGNQPVGKQAYPNQERYRNTIVDANPIYGLVNGLAAYANLMNNVLVPAHDQIKAAEQEYVFLANMMMYLRGGGGWPTRAFNAAIAAQPANGGEVLLYLAHYLREEADIPVEIKFIAHVFDGLAREKTVADLFDPLNAASIPHYLVAHPAVKNDEFVGYMVKSAEENRNAFGATASTIWLDIGKSASGVGGIVWGWLNYLYMESKKYNADENSVELATFDSKCFPFGSRLAALADVCHYDQTGGNVVGDLKTYVAAHSAGGTPVPMEFLEFFHHWLGIL